MRREDLLPLVVSLGKAFAARGMYQHLQKLRLYYFALRRGLTTGGNDLDVHWSERFVIDWLKTLRVPPYQEALELRSRSAGCKTCKAQQATSWVYTDGLFPGGVRMRCQTCGEVWLEPDAPAPSS